MRRTANEWVSRFSKLDRNSLADQMMYIPPPLPVTAGTVSYKEIEEIKTSFSKIFLPTDQVLTIAEYLIELAKSHSERAYPSKKKYVKNIYLEKSPLPKEYPSVVLTGPAGSGKTMLLEKLAKCLDIPSVIDIPRHGSEEQVIYWESMMVENLTSTKLLQAYLKSDGEPDSTNISQGALVRCRRRAYRRGVSLLSMDESQFHSFSSRANSAVTKSLMNLVRLGLPHVIAANYSLLHKLLRRGAEDIQRLLGDPRILLPDGPNSEDWLWTLDAYFNVAPRLYEVEITSEAAEHIHFWTAGIKRLLGRLLVIAAELSIKQKAPVDLKTLEEAYLSTSYSMLRKDCELMHQQAKTNKQALKSRPDLWCPLDLPQDVKVEQLHAAARIESAKIKAGYIRASLTPEERKLHKSKIKAKRKKRKTRATSGKSKKDKAAQLLDAERKFKSKGA